MNTNKRGFTLVELLTYGLSLDLSVCASSFNPSTITSTSNNPCAKYVTVKYLKDHAYLTDNAKNCQDEDYAVVYNSYVRTEDTFPVGEYKVWAPDNICRK